MRYGFVLPGGTALEQVELAKQAEAAGWDAVFVWEAAFGVDAWVLLTAMAAATERVQLGTMLTPLPWRRPWKVASQVSTLQEVSGGRAILAVGTGAVDTGLGDTGEATELKTRAGRLDEGIDVIRSLWAGDLTHKGEHFQLDLSPRQDQYRGGLGAPIWCVGVWPSEASMTRILKCDAMIPAALVQPGDDPLWPGARFKKMEPADITAAKQWLVEHGAPASIDMIWEGATPSDDPGAARAEAARWAEAGATWWLESRWENADEVAPRIKAGPPK